MLSSYILWCPHLQCFALSPMVFLITLLCPPPAMLCSSSYDTTTTSPAMVSYGVEPRLYLLLWCTSCSHCQSTDPSPPVPATECGVE